MPTRQERRRQERLAKKQGKGEKRYDIDVQLIQPWSVPVFKTILPPDILQTMIDISDQLLQTKKQNLTEDILQDKLIQNYWLNMIFWNRQE